MGIEPNAGDVPDVAWEYWGWILTMRNNPGMYGVNERRENCHERLCAHYRISREQSLSVTDHLNKYENAVQMHDALRALRP
jgi:hypothetical protein